MLCDGLCIDAFLNVPCQFRFILETQMPVCVKSKEGGLGDGDSLPVDE